MAKFIKVTRRQVWVLASSLSLVSVQAMAGCGGGFQESVKLSESKLCGAKPGKAMYLQNCSAANKVFRVYNSDGTEVCKTNSESGSGMKSISIPVCPGGSIHIHTIGQGHTVYDFDSSVIPSGLFYKSAGSDALTFKPHGNPVVQATGGCDPKVAKILGGIAGGVASIAGVAGAAAGVAGALSADTGDAAAAADESKTDAAGFGSNGDDHVQQQERHSPPRDNDDSSSNSASGDDVVANPADAEPGTGNTSGEPGATTSSTVAGSGSDASSSAQRAQSLADSPDVSEASGQLDEGKEQVAQQIQDLQANNPLFKNASVDDSTDWLEARKAVGQRLGWDEGELNERIPLTTEIPTANMQSFLSGNTAQESFLAELDGVPRADSEEDSMSRSESDADSVSDHNDQAWETGSLWGDDPERYGVATLGPAPGASGAGGGTYIETNRGFLGDTSRGIRSFFGAEPSVPDHYFTDEDRAAVDRELEAERLARKEPGPPILKEEGSFERSKAEAEQSKSLFQRFKDRFFPRPKVSISNKVSSSKDEVENPMFDRNDPGLAGTDADTSDAQAVEAHPGENEEAEQSKSLFQRFKDRFFPKPRVSTSNAGTDADTSNAQTVEAHPGENEEADNLKRLIKNNAAFSDESYGIGAEDQTPKERKALIQKRAADAKKWYQLRDEMAGYAETTKAKLNDKLLRGSDGRSLEDMQKWKGVYDDDYRLFESSSDRFRSGKTAPTDRANLQELRAQENELDNSNQLNDSEKEEKLRQDLVDGVTRDFTSDLSEDERAEYNKNKAKVKEEHEAAVENLGERLEKDPDLQKKFPDENNRTDYIDSKKAGLEKRLKESGVSRNKEFAKSLKDDEVDSLNEAAKKFNSKQLQAWRDYLDKQSFGWKNTDEFKEQQKRFLAGEQAPTN